MRQGQALAEFALILPLALMLALGAADVATMTLEHFVALNAAESVASMGAVGVLEDDPLMVEEAARGCREGTWALEYTPPLVTASLTCPHASLSSLLPSSFTVTATAVQDVPEESPMP